MSDNYERGIDRREEKDAEVSRQEKTRGWPLYYIFGFRTEGRTAFWIEIQGPNGPARRVTQGFGPEPITMHDVVVLAQSYDLLPQDYEETPFRFYDDESTETASTVSERGDSA